MRNEKRLPFIWEPQNSVTLKGNSFLTCKYIITRHHGIFITKVLQSNQMLIKFICYSSMDTVTYTLSSIRLTVCLKLPASIFLSLPSSTVFPVRDSMEVISP